jgi:polysaccharide export outer membrane protein
MAVTVPTRQPGASKAFRGRRAFLAIACLLGLAGAARGQEKAGAASPRPPGTASYVIGPGDVLHIFVWKEPELSRELTVRIDGKISVTLLGEVQAGGRTPENLAQQLGQEFKRFIGAPQVTVSVVQPTSTRIFVLGQVQKSGDFPLSTPLTVVQALALAGGFKEFARTDSIVIIRRDGSVLPVNYKKLEGGKEVAQNVPLRPGDTVVVP